jgi:hypothetical protein
MTQVNLWIHFANTLWSSWKVTASQMVVIAWMICSDVNNSYSLSFSFKSPNNQKSHVLRSCEYGGCGAHWILLRTNSCTIFRVWWHVELSMWTIKSRAPSFADLASSASKAMVVNVPENNPDWIYARLEERSEPVFGFPWRILSSKLLRHQSRFGHKEWLDSLIAQT